MPMHSEIRYVGAVYEGRSAARSTRPSFPFTVRQGLDLVHTYRTRDVPSSQLRNNKAGNLWGVRPPKSSGNVFDVLADRKRYLEELSRQALSEDKPNFSRPDAFSTQDTGNEFMSYKLRHTRVPVLSYELRGEIARYPIAGGNPFSPALAASFLPAFGWTRSNPLVMDADGRTAAIPPTRSGLSQYAAPSVSEDTETLQGLFSSSIPDPAISGIGETIVELLTGNFPRLWLDVIDFIKKVSKWSLRDHKDAKAALGGQYLNVVFGWVPTIDDIIVLVRTAIHIDSLFYSDSERRKRGSTKTFRNFAWVNGYDSNDANVTGYLAADGSPWWTGLAGIVETIPDSSFYSVTYDTSFSARYSIARPTAQSDAFLRKGEEALDLLESSRRLGLTSETLFWDLVPFSWLADWFAHFGRTISNIAAFGSNGRWNVDYAYATTKVVHVMDRRIKVNPKHSASPFLTSGHATSVGTFKVRRRASPYGFALTWPKLSAYQIGVLSALGLAKSR